MAKNVNVNVATLKANVNPLKKGLREVKSETKSLGASFDVLAGRLTKLEKREKAHGKELAKKDRQLRALRKQYGRTSAAQKAMTRSLGTMTAGFITGTAAVYGLTRAMGAGFRSALDFNRVMTQVQKTTKLTDAEMERLSMTVKGLATEQGVGRSEIGAAAVIAGRLGVTDVGHIEKLAELAVKVENATAGTVPAATAIEKFARIHALTGQTLDNVEATADALVHLGNNMPVGEAAIADASVQLAAVMGRFRADPKDVLAVSAALRTAEGQDASAATFFTRALGGLERLNERGGQDFEQFAKHLGRSGKQLRMDMQENVISVVLDMIEALRQFRGVAQERFLMHFLEIDDLRSLQSAFRILPSIERARHVAGNSTNALALENKIYLESVEAQWKTAVEEMGAAMRVVSDDITYKVVPALKSFVIGLVNGASQFMENAKNNPANQEWLRLTQPGVDWAAGVIKALDDGSLKVGKDIEMALRGRATAAGTSPEDDEGMRTRPERVEEMREILRLSKDATDPSLGRQGQGAAVRELYALIEATPEAFEDRIKRKMRELGVEAVDPAVGAGSSSGNKDFVLPGQSAFLTGEPSKIGPTREMFRQQQAAVEAAAAQRLARRGGFTAAPGGEFQLAQIRSGEDSQARQKRISEEQDLIKQENDMRIRLIKMEAVDERKLLQMLRRKATRDEVYYYEQLFQIKRDQEASLLRFQLDNDKAAFELRKAQLERQLEELGDAPDAKQEANKELADRITNTIANAIKEDRSIGDAWKGLMHELAMELLDDQIMKPFKQALGGLITTVLGSITAGANRGGIGGVFDAIGGAIFGGGSPGGYGSAGSGYGVSGSGGIPGLADGGVVRRAGAVLVGERGPEMMFAPQGAAVAPLTGGAMGGVVNNFSIISEDRVALKRVIQEEMPQIIRNTEAALLAKSHGNSRMARAYA